jgi:hypothetical protein
MAVAAHHTFTSDLLNSYSHLKEFIDQNKAVEEVRQQAGSISTLQTGNLLLRWQVVDLTMAAPFLHIYTIFIEAVRKLLFYAGLTTWSIQLAVHRRLYEKDMRLEALQTFGKDCLAFSINARAQNSDDVYLQSPLPVEDIGSKRVRRLVHPGLKELVFYKDGGCCRGMSEWFFYLYFQTQRDFQDQDAHVQAVGRQFSSGAPSEAVLLQVMCPSDRNLLGLKGKEVCVITASDPPSADSHHQRITELFKSLEPGAYAVNLPRHRLNYISLSPNLGYLFDPTDGTMTIKDSKGIDTLADTVLAYTKDSDQELLALEKIEMIQ